jgi:PKD repeat protein
VDFTFKVNGLTVQFTKHTQGATSWTWDFGDGATSTQRNPEHTYADAGTYTVRLTGVGASGAKTTTSHNVTVGP